MFKDTSTEKLYNERLSRYLTAMNRGIPDRIPIRFFFQEVAARYCGYTTQQVACDYNLAFEATRRMAQDMDCDSVMLNAIWSNYGVGKAIAHKYLKVPGVDVGMDSVLQYSEPEREEETFLQENEYDEFIDDPTAFLLNKWLPRCSTRLSHPNEKVTPQHNLALISGSIAYANYMNAFGPAANALKYDAGIVSANSGMIKAPFDILADKFRGYIGLMYDCMERPEVVRKACEALIPHIVANALGGADPDKNVPITIWAHRGCVPYINQEIFDNIMWPTLKPVFEEVIASGHQILFYSEGNWEAHYKNLLELPENGIIYHLDKGDPKTAVQLKEKFSISGGLRYDLLCRGTKDEIHAHMRELFSTVGEGGGYILDASALMLNDVQPENIRTAVDYTLQHGAYSQGHSSYTKLSQTPYAQAYKPTGNPPNVCRKWEQESSAYTHLSGDTALVRKSWESVDSAAYNFLWTSVLW